MNRRDKAYELLDDIIEESKGKYGMVKGRRNNDSVNFLIKCRKLYLHLMEDGYMKSFPVFMRAILNMVELYTEYMSHTPGNGGVDKELYLTEKMKTLTNYGNKGDNNLNSYLITVE